MDRLKEEKVLILLMGCGVLGLFCQVESACSEEMPPLSPTETPLPDMSFSVSQSAPEPILIEERFFAFQGEKERAPLPEEASSRLPEGSRVALQNLQRKFSIGRKVIGQIYRPDATLSVRVEGGLRNYMSWDENSASRVLTEEEKITWALHLAEVTAESIQASIPFMGDLLAGCLEACKEIERANKKLKTKYHLHLRYSGKSLQAAYKESF
ncbi:MAG: hypothetical protein HY590_05860 [Candidatus Omnitrophica bacterium]|nr:hypothetical protein [Candidatus Omnitrophota bacterium]